MNDAEQKGLQSTGLERQESPAPASREAAAPKNSSQRSGPRKRKPIPYNPTDELDAVDRLLLAIEFANGVRSLSNQKLKEISRLSISVENIASRRKRGPYAKWIDDHAKSALELMEECQTKAIRVLREQMDDKANPKLRQRAALFFAAPAMEQRIAKLRRDAEREAALEKFNEVQRTEVTVVWQNSGPTFGDPPPLNRQRDDEPQEPITIEAESRALPSPDQLPPVPATPFDRPAAPLPDSPAPQPEGELGIPGVLDVDD